MDSSKEFHTVALQNMIFFHFYSGNEQRCNTALWGNITPSKKYLFLLCYWEMMKGTNQGDIEVLLMQTNKKRDDKLLHSL